MMALALALVVVALWWMSRRRKAKRRPGLYFRKDMADAILRRSDDGSDNT
jgi:hypothetical protein